MSQNKTATMPPSTSLLSQNSEASQDHQHCLVCYSDLEYAGILPCGHNDVCATCHLRLRNLHSDTKCIMCKTPNETIVVDTDHEQKQFQDYPIWGNELGSEFVHRPDVGMFFPVDYYGREILPLFGFACTEPKCTYDGTTPDPNIYEKVPNSNKKKSSAPPKPLRALQDHLRVKHRLTLCNLCVEHRRDFVSLLPRFSPTQLKKHLSKGDGATSGFKGHPLCEFCRPKRFYDLTRLYQHLQREHYKCDVCDKQGLPNQYFRDYSGLARHFEKQHFLCLDPQCLAARFIVFENEIDLRAHERSVHGRTSGTSTKIQLEFRVRRPGQEHLVQQDLPTDDDFQYGLDGQAFVPEALPRVAEPDEQSSHPLHLARTAELRAHAAQIRQEREMDMASDAYPALNQESRDTGLRVGWTGEGGTAVVQRAAGNGGVRNTTENFPALPSAGNKKKTQSVDAKMRSSGVSGGRSFAAMRNAAMGLGSDSSAGGASWGAGAQQPAAVSSNLLFTSSAPAATTVSRSRESELTPENFPSLSGTTGARYPLVDRVAQKAQAPHPALKSSVDFPPPPSIAHPRSVREKIVGQNKSEAPTQAALNNVLDFPPPSTTTSSSVAHGRATVEHMKATLGSAKYKELKNLTREFAADSLSPEAYIDHAAALFDSGYADRDFRSFLPALLSSCPNGSTARQATSYMERLSRSQFRSLLESRPRVKNISTDTATGWSGSPSLSATSAYNSTTSTMNSVDSTNGGWASVSAANRPRPTGVSTAAASYRPAFATAGRKQKIAWGSATGGVSAVARVKATPGSVAVAAAQEGPKRGTATKFMAKQTKQQTKQEQQPTKNTTKKNKKKQNAELRALAFGK